MTKILITGGAGFLGYHLATALSMSEDNEIVLADDADLRRLRERRNISVVTIDLTRPEEYAKLQGPYAHVYHLAAIIGVENVLRRPHDVVVKNALSTLHLLDWFVRGGGQKILFSSTSEAYAWTQQFYELAIPTPEAVPLALTDLSNPRISYAGSKIHGELAVTQVCRAHDKAYTIVRYHNVYGPRMGYEHVIPQLFERVRGGENPLKVYSASHQRAFCYVADAVNATIIAMTSEEGNGETFNIGNQRSEVRIDDLALLIGRLAGKQVTIKNAVAANDPIVRRCPDMSKTKRLLGFEASVGLEQGVAETLAWYETSPRQRPDRG